MARGGKGKKKNVKSGRSGRDAPAQGPTGMMVVKSSVPLIDRPRATTSMRLTEPRNSAHQKACSVLDPFCDHAIGAKLPYGNGGAKTLGLTERAIVTITTDANGNAGFYLNPCLYFGYGSLAMNTVPAVTAVNAYTSYALFASLGGTTSGWSYRVTSWGFKFNYQGSDYTNEGRKTLIRMNFANFSDFTNGVTGTSEASAAYFPGYSISRLPVPVTYIGRPNSSMDQSKFIPVAPPGGTSDDDSLPWDSMVVGIISGAVASTVIGFLDVVVNYELLPSFTGVGTLSVAAKVATSQHVETPGLMRTVERVWSSLEQFWEALPLERISAVVASRASSALSEALGSGTRRMLM